MKLVANKPCTLSGKRYFIGEEIPAEAVADPVALEKMGVLTVIRDGIPVETLEECVASVGEVFFKIEIVKGDKGFDLDVTEPQLQEAVKTMQMNQKDAVAHITGTIVDGILAQATSNERELTKHLWDQKLHSLTHTLVVSGRERIILS